MIESGRSFAVIITGTVPPQVRPGAEEAWLLPSITTCIALGPYLKTARVKTSTEDPQTLSDRLYGPSAVVSG